VVMHKVPGRSTCLQQGRLGCSELPGMLGDEEVTLRHARRAPEMSSVPGNYPCWKITPNLRQPDKSRGRDGAFLEKKNQKIGLKPFCTAHPRTSPSVPGNTLWFCCWVRGWVAAESRSGRPRRPPRIREDAGEFQPHSAVTLGEQPARRGRWAGERDTARREVLAMVETTKRGRCSEEQRALRKAFFEDAAQRVSQYFISFIAVRRNMGDYSRAKNLCPTTESFS